MRILVRNLHLLGAGIMFGGAVYLTIKSWWDDINTDAPSLLLYEWLFWGAMGIQVMTGVGQLGRYGESLTNLSASWAGWFSMKMGLIVVLLVWSVYRSLRVVGRERETDGARISWTFSYGATAVLLALILLQASRLAHG